MWSPDIQFADTRSLVLSIRILFLLLLLLLEPHYWFCWLQSLCRQTTFILAVTVTHSIIPEIDSVGRQWRQLVVLSDHFTTSRLVCSAALHEVSCLHALTISSVHSATTALLVKCIQSAEIVQCYQTCQVCPVHSLDWFTFWPVFTWCLLNHVDEWVVLLMMVLIVYNIRGKIIMTILCCIV